jgi:hypothetical protein
LYGLTGHRADHELPPFVLVLYGSPLLLTVWRRCSSGWYRKRDIERALPGISPATIRLVLNELRDTTQIRLEGSGPGARWHRRQGC